MSEAEACQAAANGVGAVWETVVSEKAVDEAGLIRSVALLLRDLDRRAQELPTVGRSQANQ
jgi:hypothetical protein